MSETTKKVSEMRISEIKAELERRKMDTLGPKSQLIDRLEKAIRNENIKKGGEPEPETEVEAAYEAAVVKIKVEPGEGGDAAEQSNDDVVHDEEHGELEDENGVDQVGDVDDECMIIEECEEAEDQSSEKMDDVLDGGDSQKNGIENNAEELGESANNDNEESLSLTIGEDEKKQIHDGVSLDKEKSVQSDEKRNDDDGDADKNAKKAEKKTSSEQRSTSSAKASSKKDSKEKSTTESSNAAAAAAAATTTGSSANKSATATTPSVTGGGNKVSTLSRNLWVSGLSTLTRASDLKTIFSKYGKVIGAKVVTNTRAPSTRCYGYVTMATASDATVCIENLHRTELHGRIISVERTKNEIGGSSNAANAKKDDKSGGAADERKKDEDRKAVSSKSKDEHRKKEERESDRGRGRPSRDNRDKNYSNNRPSRGTSAHRSHRAKSNERPRYRDIDRERELRRREQEREREHLRRQQERLSYQKLREERERQRLREKERELREEERRRRQEENRLAEERKKLAQERERLEREKSELMRLERERQKLEREKIELERLELKRQQMKLLQSREATSRGNKRVSTDRFNDASDRKRSTFESSTTSRYESAADTTRTFDKKSRDDFTSASSKRGVDDYSSSNKRLDYSKRDEFPSAVSSKRATDDYSAKRGASDYTKRGVDEFASSKRDEYGPSKTRDDVRHINAGSTVAANGPANTYGHKSVIGARFNEPERSNSSSYRRGDDLGSNKRYESSGGGGYGSNPNASGSSWGPSSSSASGHPSSVVKSYANNIPPNMHSGGGGGSNMWSKHSNDDNNWRPMQTQDRYDRPYNERSTTYQGGSNTGNNMYGSGRPNQDRYGPQISRY